MLEYIKKEIEAKEMATFTCASYSQIPDQNCEAIRYSLPVLMTKAEKEKFKKIQRPCLFCNSFDHSQQRYFKISDLKIKRNILKRNSRCFVFFDTGLFAPKYSSDCKFRKYQGNTLFLFT